MDLERIVSRSLHGRLALAGALLLLTASARAEDAEVALPEGRPHRFLSEYRLFRDLPTQTPRAGLLPYALNTPLFSDYARKLRFVWVPPGSAARYHPDEAFAFPVGSVLVKTFAYPRGAGLRLVETRLLIRRPQDWVGLPYVWNEDQSDARLRRAGTALDLHLERPGREPRPFRYLVPNVNQCKACHAETGTLAPIGPKARHLNRVFAPAGSNNQLAHWSAQGILAGAPPPEEAPRLARWDDPTSGDLDARARAWLEVNCAHCHNPRGPAASSGLDLRSSARDPHALGVYKRPVAAGRGSGGRRFAIVPGRPEASILLHRIAAAEDPAVMMPELGRTLAHAEGVALISEWIARLGEDGRARAE